MLASVLVRAKRIRDAGSTSRLVFCDTDADLRPWGRHGEPRGALAKLYAEVGIEFFADFAMTVRRRASE